MTKANMKTYLSLRCQNCFALALKINGNEPVNEQPLSLSEDRLKLLVSLIIQFFSAFVADRLLALSINSRAYVISPHALAN